MTTELPFIFESIHLFSVLIHVPDRLTQIAFDSPCERGDRL